MLIDQSHRPWFIGTLVALAVAVLVYIPYAHAVARPSGGSTLGIVYGSVGFACMLFAGLLGLRKKFPIWRIGRAQSWMRGHLWLGFLSFPLILLHGAFHFGGTLTRVMMWMFIFIFISGIFGAVLQHYMPRQHTASLPMETIFEQIDHVRDQLVMEAGQIVEESCATLDGELSHASEQQLAVAAAAGTHWDITVAGGLEADEAASHHLREFFENELLPYLDAAGGKKSPLASATAARDMFQQLRINLPPGVHEAVGDLESLSEEKRQLDQQKRYHVLLHGWLLVHIPLSYAVLLLGALHAVLALKY